MEDRVLVILGGRNYFILRLLGNLIKEKIDFDKVLKNDKDLEKNGRKKENILSWRGIVIVRLKIWDCLKFEKMFKIVYN